MRCVSCGRESPEGFKFCQSCGAILAKPMDLRDSRLEAPRQMVARAVRERKKTDRKLSVLWVVAVILVIVISVILSLGVLLSAFLSDPFSDSYPEDYSSLQWISSIIGIGSTVLYAALAYHLVKRQNDHYARESVLRRGVMTLIRTAAWSPERMNAIVPEMMSLSSAERTFEKHRNAWFWVFIVVVPQIVDIFGSLGLWITTDSVDGDYRTWILITLLIAAFSLVGLALLLYLAFFLTKTMEEHDGRWNIFAYNTRRAMTKLGFRHGVPYRVSRLPERSMPLYLLMTMFTGIFALYWLYVLIKDPNDHFTYQWEFEDNIMSAMNPYDDSPTSWVSPR